MLALVGSLGGFAHPASAAPGGVAGGATATAASSTASGSSNSYSVTWSLLDPQDDWAADTIRSVFPVLSSSTSSTNGQTIGNENSVIGTMLGWLSGFVMAIAMAWVTYSWFVTSHRAAETGALLGNNQSHIAFIKLGVASILMFPIATGFNGAQALVVQGSLWGIGMAKTIYHYAIEAIGPDGKVIATPIVPGTKGIVTNLVEDEFCRALINVASNNANMIPAPTGRIIQSATGDSSSNIVSYAYNMAFGDGIPTCGAISLSSPSQGQTNFLGVSVDQASMQQSTLDAVLVSDIRPAVEGIAQRFWASKKTQDLAPLLGVVIAATNDYTSRLSREAAQIKAALQKTLADRSQTLNSWGLGQSDDATNTANRLDSLGWSGAGAYYLEFARLNGQTLSLMTATPNVMTPSYSGLGPALTSDIAPFVQSSHTFLANIKAEVATTDGMDTPGGYSDLYAGAMPGGDGASVLSQLFRSLHLSDSVLQTVVGFLEPSGTDGYWTDPFGNLMGLGNYMITTAVLTMGTASIVSSTPGAIGTAILSVLSGQPEGVIGAGVGHAAMQFFATPVMLGCAALLTPGLMIAFVLPMVPFIMWVAGIAGWLMLVCEAVIAAPLWMLAHMTLNGEGLHGNAKQGYALLFNVLFRPTLMLFGLFLGYFVFDAISWLIHQTFGVAAGFVLAHNWLVTNFIGVWVLVCLFVLIHLTLALMCFRLIAIVPDRVPQMIGFGGAARVDVDAFSRDAAVVGMAGALRTLQTTLQAPNQGGGPASPPGGGGAGDGGGPPNPPGGGGAAIAGNLIKKHDTTSKKTT
ncbi:hypothetical protein A0U89_15265 (plasmid) [Kozakia baliensis]|uniref:DotA/TraY family protein n=5 Tax=Kozakia baliensis TaxID=153496 RepID=A0A1D8UYN8_9PROT|nr:hypothetical protein A0U89_15265 [Kozakia baliensis]